MDASIFHLSDSGHGRHLATPDPGWDADEKHVSNLPPALGLAAMLGLIALAAVPSPAAIVQSFEGGGQNPESGNSLVLGMATFTLVTAPGLDTLTLVLQNNTSGPTPSQGAALTGVVFEFVKSGTNPVLSLASVSPTLTPGSRLFSDGTTSTESPGSLAGSYTAQINTPPEYGVATTGFKSQFKGGTIGLGNSSPDYGVVSASTFTGGGFGGSKFPLVRDSLTFTLTGDLSGVTGVKNVEFLFGTDGTGRFSGSTITTASAPEPSSVVTVGMAAAIGLGYAWRKRQQAAA
jgi:hypothetical protein